MSLQTVRGSQNIPEGAVQLTKKEAVDVQKKVIENWPSFKEVFFLRYGRYITSATGFITSAVCVNVYNPILKFGIGTIKGVIPAIAFPTLTLYWKTDTMLTNEILTLKMDCPLCFHLKYLALQFYTGMVFPSLVGMLSLHKSYNVTLQNDGKEYWKKVWDITRANHSKFKCVLVLHGFIAFLIPYAQNMEIAKIMGKSN